MASNALTRDEREEIRVGIAEELSNTAIAERLGRHRSTVWAEIVRNGGRDQYRAVDADEAAVVRRARPKIPKLVRDRALAAHIGRRLRAKDSPQRIAIELERGTHGVRSKICHETIYQAIFHPDRGLPRGLHQGLHLGRRARRSRRWGPPASNSLGIYCRIHDRPAIADERSQVGHLEGDQIVGRLNQSALLTVFDRASRYLWLARLEGGKGADATTDALIRLLRRIPARHRHTLTWDQGAELAHHPQIALASGIDIYIADPKSPWQRPTNENGNALVRRYVGKGTDLSTYTTSQLHRIEHRINTIPRRSLNYATATDIYHHASR